MNIICSPQGIVNDERPGQGILDIAKAGFQSVMLDAALFCTEYELEEIGKKKKKNTRKNRVLVSEHPLELYQSMKPMLDKCRAERLNMTVAYAPYLARDTDHEDLKGLLVQLTEESIKACGTTGCRYIIIRPYFAGVEYGKEWEINREYYLHYAELAKEHHVQILLENQCKDVNGHLVRGICFEGEEAALWVDRLNEEAGWECFGFCMDAGVSNLCGQDMYDFVLALSDRLKAVIIRDCDGHQESAMLPFSCVGRRQAQTDWLSLIRGLRETGFDGELIINLADTAAVFSPILRPKLMELAFSVADYFKWQIEIENLLKKHSSIVLFGAGNMCRNYMKCYGKTYPPLFTCDNNSAVWGTIFCGLEVRSPESLKDLPKDCAVFICNVYYREIEKQLRDMGIENPIEFFNDEYMPSFYFDRLEDQ